MMLLIMHVKKGNKIQQVGCVECAVFERKQFLQVGVGMLQAELMRRIVHQLHQFVCFVDDGGTVAPGKNGSEKSGDLYVLFFCEPPGYRDWIFLNEKRLIIAINLPV